MLDALQPEITVTGQKVKLKLGVSPVDSLLLTTERTSGWLSGGAYNYRAVYVINPIAVKVTREAAP